MTTPSVAELPLRLAPVERDRFAASGADPAAALRRRAALVREVMRRRAQRERNA